MEGYKEAAKLDELINALVKKHSIEGNEREWLTFARTVTSSLGILKELALESLNDAKPENIELSNELHSDDLKE